MIEKDTGPVLKKVSFTHDGKRNWNAKFVGPISRRDIQQLNRVITVEYAKFERQRSVNRIEQQPTASKLSKDNSNG